MRFSTPEQLTISLLPKEKMQVPPEDTNAFLQETVGETRRRFHDSFSTPKARAQTAGFLLVCIIVLGTIVGFATLGELVVWAVHWVSVATQGPAALYP
jgi:hypothetical protein